MSANLLGADNTLSTRSVYRRRSWRLYEPPARGRAWLAFSERRQHYRPPGGQRARAGEKMAKRFEVSMRQQPFVPAVRIDFSGFERHRARLASGITLMEASSDQ